MLKRICVFIIFILILLSIVQPYRTFADEIYEGEPSIETLSRSLPADVTLKKPQINAGAAIVMDVKSGRILYEKNAYSRRAIASTTKIMTAILAIENGRLDDEVVVSKRAAGVWGSTIKLKAGDKYSLRELLYGLMLNSGNDAAIAVAEHIGGSVENFIEMMNEKARELKAVNTSFKTPHGLDTPGHFSTAYDLAIITRYALGNETFSNIVKTITAQIPGKSLHNTNEMLELYSGADGVKTGYTGQAGRCLVTSATRDGWRIVSVVLGCASRSARAQSSKSILDYAYNNYKPYTLLKIDDTIARLPVVKGIRKSVAIQPVEEIHLPLRTDEVEAIETRINLPDKLNAPVIADIEVGTIEYVLNNEVIAQADLKTSVDVRCKGFIDYLHQILTSWMKSVKNED